MICHHESGRQSCARIKEEISLSAECCVTGGGDGGKEIILKNDVSS